MMSLVLLYRIIHIVSYHNIKNGIHFHGKMIFSILCVFQGHGSQRKNIHIKTTAEQQLFLELGLP